MSPTVPEVRLRRVNERPIRPDAGFVLYWMTSYRRTRHNFALDRAVEHCLALGRPLLILEPLRCGHRWASARLHAFVLAGMRDNQAACRETGVAYLPYVEPEAGAGAGLLEALADRAAVVVTDDWPCFFVPRMVEAAGRKLEVRLEAVDGNGLYPMRATDKVFGRAFDLRRHLQKELAPHLEQVPSADPLARLAGLPRAALPRPVTERWPAASEALLRVEPGALAGLGIDHGVAPSAVLPGGSAAGRARLADFVERRLERYAEGRNHPDDEVASGLSPYLHFGQVGSHEILAALAAREDWSPAALSPRTDGKSSGWWRMSAGAEAFLDELVTWRELGFNLGCHRPGDLDRYGSLPEWARKTLAEHEGDRREHLYTIDEFAESATHDEIWNAAQTELREDGRMHNYLRMLWGKKILEWTPTAEDALQVMVELNNRYAIDGRDPNSYSGIFWVLGRYDRPWAPERPVFGMIRYMSSDNTRRKLKLRGYLECFGRGAGQGALFDLDG
jgi:deoxyribodipyrimidine photo-lyase